MTIYGTPGSTPLNTAPFQGTSPGNAVGATNVQVNPGVGMFPPNSNTASGDSVIAAQARGAIPHNQLVTNAGKHAALGRPVLETMGRGEASGYGVGIGGYDSLNSDANGGAGPGAGQSNQTEGPTTGSAAVVEGSAPAALLTTAATYGG